MDPIKSWICANFYQVIKINALASIKTIINIFLIVFTWWGEVRAMFPKQWTAVAELLTIPTSYALLYSWLVDSFSGKQYLFPFPL